MGRRNPLALSYVPQVSMVVLSAPVLHSFLHPLPYYSLIMDGVSFCGDFELGHVTFFGQWVVVDVTQQGWKCVAHWDFSLLLLPAPSEEQALVSLLSKEDRMRDM